MNYFRADDQPLGHLSNGIPITSAPSSGLFLENMSTRSNNWLHIDGSLSPFSSSSRNGRRNIWIWRANSNFGSDRSGHFEIRQQSNYSLRNCQNSSVRKGDGPLCDAIYLKFLRRFVSPWGRVQVATRYVGRVRSLCVSAGRTWAAVEIAQIISESTRQIGLHGEIYLHCPWPSAGHNVLLGFRHCNSAGGGRGSTAHSAPQAGRPIIGFFFPMWSIVTFQLGQTVHSLKGVKFSNFWVLSCTRANQPLRARGASLKTFHSK